MARQVLDNGVILPSEYSDDWYDDMTSNLTKLDEVIGSDAEKLSASDVGAAAISNDYDDLDDKPAYNILRRASVTLTAGGTGNYTDLDSDSKIKAGDYVLDAANKLYSITAIDAANSTYTVSAAALFTVTDKAELGAAALSNSYDDLSNLPGYGILRFCSTAITDNSSVAFANISSVSKIAAGDFLLDTDAKLYQISSIDTANETVSVTTPLTQLAVDSSVMHLSGNETTRGIKTFSNYIPIDGTYLGNESSTNERTNLCLRSNRDTTDLSGAYISRFRPNKNQGALSGSDNSFISISFLENETRYTRCFDFGLTGWDADGIPQTYYFISLGSKGALGTSSRKWQTMNGLEPSCLSLPSGNSSDRLDISSYITAFDGTTNSYTPLANGWISISVNNSTEVYVFLNNLYGVDNNRPTAGSIRVTLPVLKGITVAIRITGGSLAFARFIPCQGNV